LGAHAEIIHAQDFTGHLAFLPNDVCRLAPPRIMDGRYEALAFRLVARKTGLSTCVFIDSGVCPFRRSRCGLRNQ